MHSLIFVIGADHWQGLFHIRIKIILCNNNGSIKAMELYGLGEIECQKDAAKLLALAFTLRLNAALKQIVRYKRRDNRQLVIRDGSLAVYKKDNIQGAEHVTAEEHKTEAGKRSLSLPLVQATKHPMTDIWACSWS
jgi:hypothetical protein